MWPTPLIVDHRGDGLIFYKVHQMSAEKLHKSTLVNGGNLLAPDFSGMVLYASDSWDTLDWNNTSFNWTWLINCYRFCALFSVILIINCGGSQEIRIMIYCWLYFNSFNSLRTIWAQSTAPYEEKLWCGVCMSTFQSRGPPGSINPREGQLSIRSQLLAAKLAIKVILDPINRETPS